MLFVILAMGQENAVVVEFGQKTAGTITLPQDKILVLELPAKPSTGYSWEVVDVNDKVLCLDQEYHFETEAGKAIGAGGTRKIRFASLQEGESAIHLVYSRPWEETKADMQITYQVSAEGPYSGDVEFKKPAIPVFDLSSEDYEVKALPSQYEYSGETSVKNQGSCGSCWAFAACAVFEHVINGEDGNTRDLSEQFLVNCNEEGWGCSGGMNPFDYFEYKVVSGGNEAGAVYESDCPYQASDGYCNAPYPHHEKIDAWDYAGSSYSVPSVTEIKEAIYNYGPVWCAVYSDSYFSNYSGGVFQGSSNSQPNHAVVITGWDDNNQCWIMKNSWGSSWGENGYMRIKYGANNIGYAAAYVDYNGTTPPDEYCASAGNDASYEWISQVDVGDFSYSSGSDGGYADYTGQTITLTSGASANVTLTPGFNSSTYQEYWKIWIDFNNDKDFDDAGEEVFSGNGSAAVSGSFTVSSGASGTTRMRVTMKYNGAPTSCETFDYGEVEDYTVTFGSGPDDTEPPTAPASLTASNVTETTVDLSWNASTDNVGVDHYTVFQDGNSIGTTTNTSATVSGLTAATTYTFTVKAEDAAGNVSSASNAIEVTTDDGSVSYCESYGQNTNYEWIDLVELGSINNTTSADGGYGDYTNLSTDLTRGSNVTIYISAGFASSSYTEYWHVWIDFDQNGTFDSDEELVNGSSSSADQLYASFDIPSDAVLGQTRMRVTMKYNSAASPCETFTYGEVEDYTVNITNYSTNYMLSDNDAVELGNAPAGIEIYPNPATSYLNVQINEGERNSTLSIYNTQGSLVKTVPVNSDSEEIDVSELPAGVYILKLHDERVPFIKQFIKE